MILLGLINNLALLVALSVASGLLRDRWSLRRLHPMVQGLLFGLTAATAILCAVVLTPGVIFDGRSVILSLGALYFGPAAAATAATMALAARLWIGGSGATAGCTVILWSAAIGIPFYLWRKGKNEAIPPRFLLLFGVLVHSGMLAILAAFGTGTPRVLAGIAPYILLAYPIATVLIGKILCDQALHTRLIGRASVSEARLLHALERMPSCATIYDEQLRLVYMNRISARLAAAPAAELVGRHIDDVWPPEFDCCKDMVRQIMASGEDTHRETSVINSEGQILFLSVDFVFLPAVDEKRELLCLAQDVTDRRMAEETLRSRQSQLEQAQRLARLGSWEGNPKLMQTSWSEEACEILCLTRTDSSFPEFINRVHPEDRIKVLQAREGMLAGANSMEVEHRILLDDGEIRHIHARAALFRDEGGNPKTLSGVVQDVTDHYRQEQARREEAERLLEQRKALLRLAGKEGLRFEDLKADLMQVTEISAVCLGILRCGVWLYGKDRSTMEAIDLYDARLEKQVQASVLNRERFPKYFEALEQLEIIDADNALEDPRTAEFTGCYLIPVDIGSMLDVPIHLKGEVAGVLCLERTGKPQPWTADQKTFALAMANLVSLCLEVAERKKLEEALRQSEARFRELADNVQEVFYNEDVATGRILYVNPAYERIWGRSVETLHEDPHAFLNAIHPEDRPKVETARVLQCAGEQTQLMYRINDASGKLRWIEDFSFPVLNAEGKAARIVGFARDVTEAKLAEEERTRLEAQLRQAQKMESVGRLAGGIAHDFNNVLSIILGTTELALQRGKLDDALRQDIIQIQKSAQRSADLTRQLLGFARKQTIAPRAMSLNEHVEGMLKMMRKFAGEHIEIRWLPFPQLRQVFLDPAQADQILTNLIANARDAITDHGNITIETRNFTVPAGESQQSLRTGEYVLLVVSDTRMGMDAETRAQIFEPFFTTKGPGSATGLGLATVYGIVKQNDGYINVYSEPQTGTCFKIYLKAHGELPHDSSADKHGPETGHETVLVVEDEPMLLQMLRKLLCQLGYTVLTAGSPEEALQLAETHPGQIDLVLTDVIMPNVNGKQLWEQLRRARKDMRVLFMSGYTHEVIARQGILEKGLQFIEKPFTLKDLASRVRETLAQESASA